MTSYRDLRCQTLNVCDSGRESTGSESLDLRRQPVSRSFKPPMGLPKPMRLLRQKNKLFGTFSFGSGCSGPATGIRRAPSDQNGKTSKRTLKACRPWGPQTKSEAKTNQTYFWSTLLIFFLTLLWIFWAPGTERHCAFFFTTLGLTLVSGKIFVSFGVLADFDLVLRLSWAVSTFPEATYVDLFQPIFSQM